LCRHSHDLWSAHEDFDNSRMPFPSKIVNNGVIRSQTRLQEGNRVAGARSRI
jgi:hypothetical protein